jgi:hypothetical protein
MKAGAVQTQLTWAEDRAPVGTDPSANPGVGAEDRAGRCDPGSVPLQNPFSFNTNAKNPTRNLSTTRTCSNSQTANANGLKFHFTVNQDTSDIFF